MYINNMLKTNAATIVQNGNFLPKSEAVQANSQVAESSSQPRKVDMKNISLNEINELIKSGVDGLLDIAPAIPGMSIDGQDFDIEYAADVKIDLLGQIQGYIDFNKSIGESTAFAERVYDNLKKIDGTDMPKRFHVVV